MHTFPYRGHVAAGKFRPVAGDGAHGCEASRAETKVEAAIMDIGSVVCVDQTDHGILAIQVPQSGCRL